MGEKIPKGWKKVKLGEVAEITSSKRIYYKEYVDKGIPFYRSKEIILKYNRQKIVNTLFITEEKYNEIKNKFGVPQKNDILLTSVGTLGIPYLVKKKDKFYFKDGNLIWFKDIKNELPMFLYYWFLSPVGKQLIENSSIGSTQSALTIIGLKNLVILLPPLPEQKAIAAVLSSLDDKIDLLHRENKTLEKMAETLFRQWFIEEAKEDWEEVSLGDSELAKIIKSGIKKFDGIKIYLATGDVNDTEIQSGEYITYDKRPSRANMQPVEFSVWFAKKGGVRKLLMFDDYSDTEKYVLSTGFTGLKTTELSHYYIWCFILSEEFQEIKDSFVSGTVQPDINNDGVKQIMILEPDKYTMKKFNEIVKPYFMKIQSNKLQIRTLEKLRDTLLPKLMSGKVRVRE